MFVVFGFIECLRNNDSFQHIEGVRRSEIYMVFDVIPLLFYQSLRLIDCFLLFPNELGCSIVLSERNVVCFDRDYSAGLRGSCGIGVGRYPVLWLQRLATVADEEGAFRSYLGQDALVWVWCVELSSGSHLAGWRSEDCLLHRLNAVGWCADRLAMIALMRSRYCICKED